jgi:hypothetical protein
VGLFLGDARRKEAAEASMSGWFVWGVMLVTAVMGVLFLHTIGIDVTPSIGATVHGLERLLGHAL